jgi:DNA polymerase III subunit epsilon
MKSPHARNPIDAGVPFVAIDFETADYGRDSACAIALVRVEGHVIVDRRYALIRPPRRDFLFTYVHGITWEAVRDAPTFADIWASLCDILDGAHFLAAHNSGFDQSVLNRCCAHAGLNAPTLPFVCTVQLARRTWKLRSARLPNVCTHLNIPLVHHDPRSDAEACARIVIEAGRALCQAVP